MGKCGKKIYLFTNHFFDILLSYSKQYMGESRLLKLPTGNKISLYEIKDDKLVFIDNSIYKHFHLFTNYSLEPKQMFANAKNAPEPNQEPKPDYNNRPKGSKSLGGSNNEVYVMKIEDRPPVDYSSIYSRLLWPYSLWYDALKIIDFNVDNVFSFIQQH